MRHKRVVDRVVEAQQIVQMLVLRRSLMASHLRRDVLDLQHVVRRRDVRKQGRDNESDADEAQKTRTDRANAMVAIIDPGHQHQRGQSETGPNQVERGINMHFSLRLSRSQRPQRTLTLKHFGLRIAC